MKRRLTALILTLGLVSGLAACGTTGQTTPTGEAPLANDPGVSYENFLSAASADYAYDVALELSTNPDFFNSELGGRNAGSDAEHAAADYLIGLMEEIGLSDVEKAAADPAMARAAETRIREHFLWRNSAEKAAHYILLCIE